MKFNITIGGDIRGNLTLQQPITEIMVSQNVLKFLSTRSNAYPIVTQHTLQRIFKDTRNFADISSNDGDSFTPSTLESMSALNTEVLNHHYHI